MVELTAVISIIGVLSAALLGGIAVLLRTQPRVMRAVAETHDEQQLLNYMYGDVRSTAAVEAGSDGNVGYTRAPAAVGCPGNPPGTNVLQLSWMTGSKFQRASYRLVPEGEGSRLDRYLCASADGAAWLGESVVNIADELDAVPPGWDGSSAPALALVTDGVVTVLLYQSGRVLSVDASLQQFGTTSPTPATDPPPVIPTTTTEGPPPTPPPPATTQPPPPPPLSLCALLDEVLNLGIGILASITPPPAVVSGLRDAGLGVLTTPLVVNATLGALVGVNIGPYDLTVRVCANVQVVYNTGFREVVVPFIANPPTCVAPPVLGLCVGLQLMLTVDLATGTEEPWAPGDHLAYLARAQGKIAGSDFTVRVGDDPATVPPPPITVPAQANPVNPVKPLQGFSVMTGGDALLNATSSAGAVAVGGNLMVRDTRDIATAEASGVVAPGESIASGLIVGGAVDFSNPNRGMYTVQTGFAHLGSAAGTITQQANGAVHVAPAGAPNTWDPPRIRVTDTRQSDQTANPVVRTGLFPFANTFTLLNFYAARMAELDPATCADVAFPNLVEQQHNQWVLTLVPNKTNVWRVTSAQLKQMDNLSLPVSGVRPSASTPLIINVTDAGSVTTKTMNWPWIQHVTADKASIIWNFANATAISADGSFYGTLFAPGAAVSLANPQVRGDVIAASMSTSGGSLERVHFARALPCMV